MVYKFISYFSAFIPRCSLPRLSASHLTSLYFFIAGMATVLIVAAVAVFEPLIAEKAAQAMIVVIASPPR